MGCLHKRGKKSAKRTYKTTLCNLASGSFLWRDFLFCAVGQLFAARRNEDGNVLHCVGYKKHDRKTDCNTTRAVEAVGLCGGH